MATSQSTNLRLVSGPRVQPVSLPPDQPLAYVRAVAYLADGSSTENLVFVNAPDNLEEMNVDLVELYATVLDRDGHPVTDLAAKDFTVLEDGKKQDVLRFDRVSGLPIHAAVALDVSASMEPNLGKAQEAFNRLHKVKTVVWSPALHADILSRCKLYDYAASQWLDFDGNVTGPSDLEYRGVSA